jgi:hypothetical protein
MLDLDLMGDLMGDEPDDDAEAPPTPEQRRALARNLAAHLPGLLHLAEAGLRLADHTGCVSRSTAETLATIEASMALLRASGAEVPEPCRRRLEAVRKKLKGRTDD